MFKLSFESAVGTALMLCALSASAVDNGTLPPPFKPTLLAQMNPGKESCLKFCTLQSLDCQKMVKWCPANDQKCNQEGAQQMQECKRRALACDAGCK